MENYKISIEVRDSNTNKLILDENGNKITDLRGFNIDIGDENHAKTELVSLGLKLNALMGNNRTIEINLLSFNEISKTWMVMFSYYVNEKRFIKH